MSFDPILTSIEQALSRFIDFNKSDPVQIVGSSSLLSFAYHFSHLQNKKLFSKAQLIVVADAASANKLTNLIEFFDPSRSCFILSEFDVSPYSGVYPSPKIIHQRINFLSRVQNSQSGDIFIASYLALQQKTMPLDVLIEFTQMYKVGDFLLESFKNHLNTLGYQATPMVEDVGQYAFRGGIVDIFSPAEKKPIRIELFGDEIQSLRYFSPDTLKSENETDRFLLAPAKECLYLESEYEHLVSRFRHSLESRPNIQNIPREEIDEISRSLVQRNFFSGCEFLLSVFYKNPSLPIEVFAPEDTQIWVVNPLEILRVGDSALEELKSESVKLDTTAIHPKLEDMYNGLWIDSLNNETKNSEFSFNFKGFEKNQLLLFSNINIDDLSSEHSKRDPLVVSNRCYSVQELTNLSAVTEVGSHQWNISVGNKISGWKNEGYRIFISVRNSSQAERLKNYFENINLVFKKIPDSDFSWNQWIYEQDHQPSLIHFIPRGLSESLRFEDEKIIFLRDDDFFGKKERLKSSNASNEFQKQAKRLNFGDLKPGDYVVHIKHGIGVYEGLKVMKISDIDSEFIQISYKEKDKLYLPVYRVNQLQKYSGVSDSLVLDKLGGTSWEKTKIKVKSHLRDIANELLLLYAKRAEITRPPFKLSAPEIKKFENSFPYEETEDQLRSINDISKDMLSSKPMDRLICGDVGFGKTEIAMRAAFFCVESQKQVAILAPTTVLSFQHFENFKKRFAQWPVEIRELNRFVSNADAKKTLKDLKEGKVDILIGTHRLLSKDVMFKDLGLLIVDEEQKFGVTHKEKVKKLKASVDTLTLSATPIPRTLNMSLVGIRDLSLINTAPVDRLPTRTFICKWDSETIRKAIESEVHRGGQVYFIHNRVQSIYGVADELRQLLPQIRMKVAHGQQDEEDLEKTMLAFFNHEIDMLISTAIVESGMDVPRANTMFIDQAHMFGLSQLYQLRGRVGRSKQRAYCYLLLPKSRQLDKEAQERLKIIQENTQLGSGIRIAQYDLELRGSGNILGDEQSGHVNSVGYELYMDLLNEAIAKAKGEEIDDFELDPEINLRIPAMIPDNYISDIRIRLSYYKALSDIKQESDVSQIEDELKDQFGPLPDPVVNLIGIMLIRKLCKDIGIRDISAGVKTITLIFTDKTIFKPETAIKLSLREAKKYSLSPDNRFNIRLEGISWIKVYEELQNLLKLNQQEELTQSSSSKNLIKNLSLFKK